VSYLDLAKLAAARRQAEAAGDGPQGAKRGDERNDIDERSPNFSCNSFLSYPPLADPGPPPEPVRQLVLLLADPATLQALRPDVLAAAHALQAALGLPAPIGPPTTRRPCATPWPDTLPGLGRRRVQAFDLCADCGTGTWVAYGSRVLCLPCALRVSNTPSDLGDGNPSAACWTCGGRRFWRSTAGRVVCRRCHPRPPGAEAPARREIPPLAR
jgi:hypothetical protein